MFPDYISMLISALAGGGLTALLTLPSAIKRARAEARNADIINMQQAMDSWHQLADERQETCIQLNDRLDQLNNKIDTLYSDLSEERNKLSAELLINNQLRIEAAKNEIKLCKKRNCDDRTPPTGY